MSHLARALSLAALLAGLLIATSAQAEAQTVSVRTSNDTSDSRITRRMDERDALSVIRSRNDDAMLLLSSQELVLQLTDATLGKVASDVDSAAATNLLSRMFRASLATLLDNAIAIELDAIAHARADGTRLVIVNHEGKEVLDNVEVNGRQVMEDFDPADAKRFATAVNAAIAKRPK